MIKNSIFPYPLCFINSVTPSPCFRSDVFVGPIFRWNISHFWDWGHFICWQRWWGQDWSHGLHLSKVGSSVQWHIDYPFDSNFPIKNYNHNSNQLTPPPAHSRLIEMSLLFPGWPSVLSTSLEAPESWKNMMHFVFCLSIFSMRRFTFSSGSGCWAWPALPPWLWCTAWGSASPQPCALICSSCGIAEWSLSAWRWWWRRQQWVTGSCCTS